MKNLKQSLKRKLLKQNKQWDESNKKLKIGGNNPVVKREYRKITDFLVETANTSSKYEQMFEIANIYYFIFNFYFSLTLFFYKSLQRSNIIFNIELIKIIKNFCYIFD